MKVRKTKHPINEQWVVMYPNGLGASIIRGPHTYGGPVLWEILPVKWRSWKRGQWIGLSEPEGYLTERQVAKRLDVIERRWP